MNQPAKTTPRGVRNEDDSSEHVSDGGRAQLEVAYVEGRGPPHEGEKHHRIEREPEKVTGKGTAVPTDEGERVAQGHLLHPPVSGTRQPLPGRVAHGEKDQYGYQESRKPDHQERHLPAEHRAEQGNVHAVDSGKKVDDISTDEECCASPDERTDGVDAVRPPQFLLGEHVAEHRVGSRRKRRLTDADTDSGKKHVGEILAEPAQRGCQTPEGHARRDDHTPRPLVGEYRDRHSHERVEQGEREPVEQTELRVAQLKIVLDRLDHQREHLPVDEREDIRDHADRHDIPLVSIRSFSLWGNS